MNVTQPDPAADRWRVGGPGVAWRETSGEIVVLDLRGSIYFGLNGTAAKLWRRLTSTARRAELVEQLASLGADEERAARDVDDFVAQLDRYGLLERVT